MAEAYVKMNRLRKEMDTRVYKELCILFTRRLKKVWWIYAATIALFGIALGLSKLIAGPKQFLFISASSIVIMLAASLFTLIYFSKIPMLQMWYQLKGNIRSAEGKLETNNKLVNELREKLKGQKVAGDSKTAAKELNNKDKLIAELQKRLEAEKKESKSKVSTLSIKKDVEVKEKSPKKEVTISLGKYSKMMKNASKRGEVYKEVAVRLQERDELFSISKVMEALIENFPEVDDDRKTYLEEVEEWVKGEPYVTLAKQEGGIRLYRITG